MQKLNIAATSCVMPGNVAKNAHFLAGKVTDIGLCFFESQSCLNYSARDLPQDLATLPLRWHVHLPIDLPWNAGGAFAARIALDVIKKVSFLPIQLVILHPPTGRIADQVALLADFAEEWAKKSSIVILLENIEHSDLVDLSNYPNLDNYGLCLDVGHLLGYSQKRILGNSNILSRVLAVHWSAPGKKDQHLPLTMLTAKELEIAREIAAHLPKNIVHVIEVFNWGDVEASIPVLESIMSGKK